LIDVLKDNDTIIFDKEKHRFIDSEDNVDEGEDEKGRVLS